MGLDMYLYRETYYSKYGSSQEEVTVGGKILEPSFTISKEDMYWRKAQPIHDWLVNYVQEGEDNCNKYDVSFSTLMQLKSICMITLLLRSKKERVAYLDRRMPCHEEGGWGSKDTDNFDWQLDNIRDTYNYLATIKQDTTGNSWFAYRSSW